MEKALLYIEELPNGHMNLKLKGDPKTVAKMVANAMKVNQEIAAAMIAPVIEYANNEGFDCGELKKMVIY